MKFHIPFSILSTSLLFSKMLNLCKNRMLKTSIVRAITSTTRTSLTTKHILLPSYRSFSSSLISSRWEEDFGRDNSRNGYRDNRRNWDRQNNNNNRGNRNSGGNRNFGGNRRGRNGGGSGEFDNKRNTSLRQGPEGDGLRGAPEYERLKELNDVDLSVLCAKEGSAQNGDFSSVETESLAEHKILSRVLVNSLVYNRGYKNLTAVQAQTMVPILRGDSVVVRAKTGTGKTAAFSVPSIQHVIEAVRNKEEGVKALIISPTRELAQQIADEISAITSYGEMRSLLTVCMVGGLSKDGQIRHAFQGKKKADIVVATPGRLFDILQVPGVGEEFSNLKIKVLDEADRLLDIGFADSLRDIDIELKEFCKTGFQTLLFSATIDRSVRRFASDELGSRAQVIDTVPKDEPEAHELVNQSVIVTESWEDIYPAAYKALSEAQAQSIADEKDIFKGIVFMPTVNSCDHFTDLFKHALSDTKPGPNQHRLQVMTLHGQMTQAARQRVADKFRKSNNAILVTTDVVARGMDFPGVSHVFQLGSPRDVASYIHRIGRTGRIGHNGEAALVITKHEKGYLRDLGRRNITIANVKNYEPEEEHVEKIKSAVNFLNHDEETKDSVVHGILSSFAHLRKEYGVDGREFLRENAKFAELLGIESYKPSSSLVKSWGASRSPPRQKYWDQDRSSASNFARRSQNSRRRY